MEFDDSRVDASQLEDRRGMGRGTMIGGGVGGLGIVGMIIALLLGGNLPGLTDSTPRQQAPAAGELATRCNTAGAIAQYDDCYVLKVFNETNEVWAATARGYQNPRLVFFTQGVRTACGAASSQTGPFYCPGDDRVYIDLGFMNALQQQLGATGRTAQAYIVAHEVGHHLQNLTGDERRVRAQQQRDPGSANQLSIALELQADCYAGFWMKEAVERGNIRRISQAEIGEALNAAAAVGDDRIQQGAGQRVDRETWTHGSAQQRVDAFNRDFSSGDANACQLGL